MIVAGFQGVSYRKEITTLGRGGSDTTAVALAAALNAERCDIFSDVDGVFSADPNVVPAARKIDRLSYQEMQELAQAGARVLNAEAVEFAKQKGIVVYSKSTFTAGSGTLIGRTVTDRTGQVIGVAYEDDLVHLQAGGMTPAAMADLLTFIDERRIGGKQLRVEQGPGGMELSLVVSLENVHDFEASRAAMAARFGGALTATDGLGALSLIGDGINGDNANVRRLLDLVAGAGAQARSVSTSSFRITALVPMGVLRGLVAACHREFIE